MLISKKGISYEEWVEERKKGLGGSDASVVLGLNRRKSRMALFLEKTGQIEPPSAGERAYWGTVLEDIVAQEFVRRSGKKIRRRNFIFQDIDREIVGMYSDRSRGRRAPARNQRGASRKAAPLFVALKDFHPHPLYNPQVPLYAHRKNRERRWPDDGFQPVQRGPAEIGPQPDAGGQGPRRCGGEHQRGGPVALRDGAALPDPQGASCSLRRLRRTGRVFPGTSTYKTKGGVLCGVAASRGRTSGPSRA